MGAANDSRLKLERIVFERIELPKFLASCSIKGHDVQVGRRDWRAFYCLTFTAVESSVWYVQIGSSRVTFWRLIFLNKTDKCTPPASFPTLGQSKFFGDSPAVPAVNARKQVIVIRSKRMA